MSDLVTIRAVIGTEPKLSITPQGLAVLKFRAVTHERKRDLKPGSGSTWEPTGIRLAPSGPWPKMAWNLLSKVTT